MDFLNVLGELTDAAEQFFKSRSAVFGQAVGLMRDCLFAGRKILVFGNGGSASQAQHFAAELVNRYLEIRPPLPAISLATDTSALTSIANDLSFDQVFSRQIEALGIKGDTALGISTSGSSPNVVAALKTAREKGLLTVALTGQGGGELGSICDFVLDVPSLSTPRVQEVHLVILHCLAEELERKFV
jgi:D-sedoheptulose 7-phosphate isomerase